MDIYEMLSNMNCDLVKASHSPNISPELKEYLELAIRYVSMAEDQAYDEGV